MGVSSRIVLLVFLAGSFTVLPAQQPPAPGQSAQEQPRKPYTYPQNREGYGAYLFGDYCRSCHGNASVERAPSPAAIKAMSPETIYAAITTGPMKEMAKMLTDTEKRGLAEYMAGRRLGIGPDAAAAAMPNRCASSPPVRPQSAATSWDGWGPDPSNARLQSAQAAGIAAAQIPSLKLKWAFGLPGASSMYAQVSVFGGKVFVGSDAGHVYSVDAASGCVNWSFQAQSGIRSAVTIGPLKPGATKYAAFFGDIHGNAYAVDESNGELLWKVSVDSHALTRIIGSPKLYEGRLYVPITGMEETESGGEDYPCCTMRGAVIALDAGTGKQIWKTYTISETPKVLRKTSTGKEVWGPSGAGVWNSPTIDPKRRAIYFGTGNNFTEPATKTSDAIMALSLDTGAILWSFQATANDIWHHGCAQGVPGEPRAPGRAATVPTENCPPDTVAPDWDFSASPMIVTAAGGRQMIVAGQKSGAVWALDPDNKGAVIWKYAPPQTRGRSSIVFGGAADDRNAYFNSRPGIYAVNLADGVEKWFMPLPPPGDAMKDHPGASAAVSAIPGVVFSVGLDGLVRALAAADGKLLWEFNTAREFQTVNGVTAKGGSMGSGGVAVSNGMIFLASGYIGFQNGAPGNVLLAFAPAAEK